MANKYALAAPLTISTGDEIRAQRLVVDRQSNLARLNLQLYNDGSFVRDIEVSATATQFLAAMASFNGATDDFTEFLIQLAVNLGAVPSGGSYSAE